jgi:uncharacterized protein
MTKHQHAPAHPNSTSPWVIDIRKLGRRPGLMRTYQRTIPAPPDFRLEVIGIPEGAPVELDLRLESASEGVFVSGSAHARIVGECARCLEVLSDEATVRLGELFAYPDSTTVATTEEDEVSQVVDDLIDTEPMVRDAVLLTLPLAPLCREDCPGLCPECGERWADLGSAHSHETLDPRWAALQGRLASDTDPEAAADERR